MKYSQQVDEETRSYFPSIHKRKTPDDPEWAVCGKRHGNRQHDVLRYRHRFSRLEITEDDRSSGRSFRRRIWPVWLNNSVILDPDAAPVSPTPYSGCRAIQWTRHVLLANITTLTGVTIQVQYLSEYADLNGFIQSLEATGPVHPRTEPAGERCWKTDIISGTLDITVYALPKIIAQDDPYTEWPFTGAYGRDDPFQNQEGLQDQNVPADAARFRVEPDEDGISRFVIVGAGDTETVLENTQPEPNP